MGQIVFVKKGTCTQSLVLPDPKDAVCEGVSWGDHTFIFTPAYWKTLSLFEPESPNEARRLGTTLSEEIAACLLGGHGIPAEVGNAAFLRLRKAGLLETTPTKEEINEALSEPLMVNFREIKYRFVRQKSRYLSDALMRLSNESPPKNDIQFRDWLTSFIGIGLKTASWVTRNWLDSDNVAIVDIHIQRAGLLMKLYDSSLIPSKNYFEMERLFLDFANGLKVRPSVLDALIWREMKSCSSLAIRQIRSIPIH